MARQNANGEKNMDGVEKAAILLIALGFSSILKKTK